MNPIVLSTAYIAPVSYYAKLMHAPKVWIETHDNYCKQTYRNRAFIATDCGPLALSIPVEKGYTIKCPIQEVRISDHGDWQHQHWVALMSNYGNSPFFDYYADELEAVIKHPYELLLDLNMALQQTICNLIGFEPNIEQTAEYVPTALLPAGIEDFREKIHPKKDFHTEDPTFAATPYYQVVREKQPFMPNLSIVDLLFNMGPESLLVLRDALPEPE